jgi:hypothetical protein
VSSGDVALEALTDFLDAVEAGVAVARSRIKAGKVEPENWDPNSVKWINADGTSGPYERCEDFGNTHFKAMKTDLMMHNGKMTRDGFFYWLFTDGSTVGRKKRDQTR